MLLVNPWPQKSAGPVPDSVVAISTPRMAATRRSVRDRVIVRAMSDSVSVQRTIAASADGLWKMVSDVTRMGSWSPETTGCEWKGTPAEAVVGARFKGKNQKGWRRWSTVCTVTESRPGEVFGFDVNAGPFAIAHWKYRFAPSGDGCTVTETWTDRRGGPMKVLGKIVSGVGDRATHNRETMEATLQQLASAAESANA